MHLTKHHGLGNDFLVVLDEMNEDPPRIDAELARRLCDRRTGIGADGLVHGRAPGRRGGGVTMVLYNSDGSRAEISGNGLRCLAQAVSLARDDRALHLVIDTDAGARTTIVESGPDRRRSTVSVDMGVVGEGPDVPETVAARAGGRVQTVDVGNPHLVVVGPDPHGIDLVAEGSWIEAQFPDGINTEWISVVDVDALDLRVWERGAGVTAACGSGACAAAWAANRWGLVGSETQVRMPGGAATVVLGDTVQLVGPAVLIATIEVDDD